jgi:carbon starvation protein
MNVLVPLFVGLAILIIAARTYPYYLSRKLGVDNSVVTPAHRLNDGVDYVPTRMHVVFGHHFASIAGAGPIVGPVVALAFGLGPTWLWIILGCVLFGAVHDMVSMFVSVREDGRSIADMSRRALGPVGYLFFVLFLIMILTLINSIFLKLSCAALTADYPISMLKLDVASTLLHIYPKPGTNILVGRIGGIATTSVLIITGLAPLVGYLTYKKCWPIARMYVICSVICLASIILGFKFPIFLEANTWLYVMSAYVFIACWVPVWLVLQPRDFSNVQILYAGMVAMLVGLIVSGFKGGTIAMSLSSIGQGNQLAGPAWPVLFITVACGAISGFHSLASTGTTVKQISEERDVRRVGYNAMILEGMLALLTLVLIASYLPVQEYLKIVYPTDPTMKSNPILAFSISMGYMLNNVFGVPIAIGAVLGIMVVEGFVVTTLDTAVRLCRYMLEELWLFIFGPVKILKNPLFNTSIAIALMLYFASSSTIIAMWKIFGAGNQLIAALALTVSSVWLLQRGKSFWFALIPAIAMTVTTFVMLILFIIDNLNASATGPLVVGAKEKGPLLFASILLLVLAVGVVVISIGKFQEGMKNRNIAMAK